MEIDNLRILRNWLLSNSDWAMIPDAPTDKTLWAAYRQALRDLPNGWEPCEKIDFPARPDEPAVIDVAEPSVTDETQQ